MYFDRLRTLAGHLEAIKSHPQQGDVSEVYLADEESRTVFQYKVLYQNWLFEELIIVFPDYWEFSAESGDAILKNFAKSSDHTPSDVIDFFGLTLPEFIHLFDVGGNQSPQIYSGNILTAESTGFDFAFNILELIDRKMKMILSNNAPKLTDFIEVDILNCNISFWIVKN